MLLNWHISNPIDLIRSGTPERQLGRRLPGARVLEAVTRLLPAGKGRGCDPLPMAVINSLQEQIAVIDREGVIVAVNQAWRNFAQDNGLCSPGTWEGMNYLKVVAAASAEGDEQAGEIETGLLDVMRGRVSSFRCEYPCHSPEESRWFMMRMTPLEGEVPGMFVISHHDITFRKLAEQQAEEMAMHDELTGLANRRHLNLFLERETRRSRRERMPLSVVTVDVDYFKQYNDELGHRAGDECLAGIGRILQNTARRPGDLAVRTGGDEFALILGNTGQREAEKLATRVLNAINELSIPSDPDRRISVSMGAATVIHERGLSQDFVLHEADCAMYEAKASGRNQLVHTEHLLDKGA